MYLGRVKLINIHLLQIVAEGLPFQTLTVICEPSVLRSMDLKQNRV